MRVRRVSAQQGAYRRGRAENYAQLYTARARSGRCERSVAYKVCCACAEGSSAAVEMHAAYRRRWHAQEAVRVLSYRQVAARRRYGMLCPPFSGSAARQGAAYGAR